MIESAPHTRWIVRNLKKRNFLFRRFDDFLEEHENAVLKNEKKKNTRNDSLTPLNSDISRSLPMEIFFPIFQTWPLSSGGIHPRVNRDGGTRIASVRFDWITDDVKNHRATQARRHVSFVQRCDMQLSETKL